MINLVRAEATRWRSRRMLWIFALVTLLAFAGLATMIFFFSKPAPETLSPQLEAVYQQDVKDWEANEASKDTCIAESSPETREFCTYDKPTRQDYSFTQDIQSLVPVISLGGGAIVALVGFILSASYIGAEMSSGSVANWLTFNPSRWKVVLSKLIVALSGTALFATLFLGLGYLAVAAIEQINGSGGQAVTWSSHVQAGGRAVALSVIVGAVGFGIALIARHTAAALGAMAAFFVARLVIGAFSFTPAMAPVQRWLPDNNALAFIMNDYSYQVFVSGVTDNGFEQSMEQRVLTLEHGLIYLLVCFAVAIVVSFVVFQRRDVN